LYAHVSLKSKDLETNVIYPQQSGNLYVLGYWLLLIKMLDYHLI